MLAIIGGSGFEKFDGFDVVAELGRATPFGLTSTGLKKVQISGKDALFISRHGDHHELLPSEINYRANIFALKQAGAQAILSFSAVGSLREEFGPGDLVIPSQYLDRTKGIRLHTFCGDGLVGHMTLAEPVCESMLKKVEALCLKMPWKTHLRQTYVCIEGPNFSARAESNYYRFVGADIIGMTHFPEYSLAREAGLPYLPCCFVTDYDSWDSNRPAVNLEEVMQVMKANNSKAFQLAKAVLNASELIWNDCDCINQGLRTGLMTPKDLIPRDKQDWLEVLLTP